MGETFFDKLKGMLSGAGDTALDLTSRIRYGVSPEEKHEMTMSRALPGAPSFVQNPDEAERYSSTYLGAKKWGKLPAEIFNALALSDFGQGAAGEAKKAVGAAGAEAGSLEAQIEAKRRQERLRGLFGER